MTRFIPLTLALLACAGGEDPASTADDTVTAPGDTPATEEAAADSGDSDAAVEEVPAAPGPSNPSFEADDLPDGSYVSSTTGATLTGWTYTTTEHGYVSLWSGWAYEAGFGPLPAPADGSQFVRFELWNTAQTPQDATAELSATFGPARGGARCTLTFAASEVDFYDISPLDATVRWAEKGAVQAELSGEVAALTGHDVDETNGRWIDLSLDVDLPADAEGATLTTTLRVSAANLPPGMALAILVDHVRFACE